MVFRGLRTPVMPAEVSIIPREAFRPTRRQPAKGQPRYTTPGGAVRTGRMVLTSRAEVVNTAGAPGVIRRSRGFSPSMRIRSRVCIPTEPGQAAQGVMQAISYEGTIDIQRLVGNWPPRITTDSSPPNMYGRRSGTTTGWTTCRDRSTSATRSSRLSLGCAPQAHWVLSEKQPHLPL